MENLSRQISNNIIFLRKKAKLTQMELAEKLNYSDKTVSKWENGDSTPSIEILDLLANFFSVGLEDIVYKNLAEQKRVPSQNVNKLVIALLAISAVWLVALTVYASLLIALNINFWLAFIWAVPASIIVLLVFNALWGKKLWGFITTSALLWTLLTALYLQFVSYNFYLLFIIGIPLQVSIILWANLKTKK